MQHAYHEQQLEALDNALQMQAKRCTVATLRTQRHGFKLIEGLLALSAEI